MPITKHSRNIVCPYCDYVDQNSWEVDFGPSIEGDIKIDCGRCGETFNVSRSVEITYTSTPINGEGNDNTDG